MAKKAGNKKDNSKKAGLIAFGATLLLYALLFKFNAPLHYLIGGGLACAVGWVVKTMATPLKGLDKNAQTKDALNVTIVEDEYARGVVEKGVEMLDALKAERDAINESVFSRRINELRANFDKLLRKVIESPDRASRLRKLNTYYFPTAIKLMQSYRSAKADGASYTSIAATREDILEMLDKLVEATARLLDTMLQDDLEDMDIEMDVFDRMLKSDGLATDELTEGLRDSAQHAARSMPVSGAPTVRPTAAPVQPVRKEVQAEYIEPAAPSLEVPMTASAAQLQRGAPVLRVPGMPEEPDFPAASQRTDRQA